MMLKIATTRWLCFPGLLLLFLLISVQDGTCQLSVGAEDAFLLEDLEGDAVTDHGNVLEESRSLDSASSSATNTATAGVDPLATKASDSSSPEPTQTDAVLTSPPIDEPVEETTNTDFEDYSYVTDEIETTEPNPSTDSLSISTGDPDLFDFPSDDGSEVEEVTSSIPQLTRRIVFAGPSASPTVPEPSATFTRPSSVVRNLDNSDNDAWLPNWPSELLQNSATPTRRPTIRFPTENPTSVIESTPIASSELDLAPSAQPTINPSFTVSKVPVTQYYFDLTSVAPSAVPGPLYDEEDLRSSSLPSPTIPDLTHLSSSLTELQSSAIVESARPVSITPTLSAPQEETVTIPGFATSPNPTPTPTPTLSGDSESVDGVEMVDNNLDGDSDIDTKTRMEDPQAHDTETSGPRPPETQADPQDGDPDYNETGTGGDVLIQDSSTETAAELPGRSDVQSGTTTNTSTSASEASSSDLVTATSTSTPTSIQPTFVRPSQAVSSPRTPLWVLLSQSTPSRPVNTQPPSMQQPSPIPSTTPVTELANPVTSSTSLAVDDPTSPPPDALSTSTMLSFPSSTIITSSSNISSSDQSVLLNASSSQTPAPPQVNATEVPAQPEDRNVSSGISVPSSSTAEPPPQSSNPEIIQGEESTKSTVSSTVDSELVMVREDSIMGNESSVEHTGNSLVNSSPPVQANTSTIELTENEINSNASPSVPSIDDNTVVNGSTLGRSDITLESTAPPTILDDNTQSNISNTEIIDIKPSSISPPIPPIDVMSISNTSSIENTDTNFNTTSSPPSYSEVDITTNTTDNSITPPPVPSNNINTQSNTSSVEYAENTLNYTSPPIPLDEVALNKTKHENSILEEPIVITLPEGSPSLHDLHTDPNLHSDLQPSEGTSVSPVSPTEILEAGEVTPSIDSSSWTPIVDQTDNGVQSIPVSTSSLTTTTSLLTTDPPELLGGFTPIMSEQTNTDYVPLSEVVTESSRVAFISPTTLVESTASLPTSSTRFAQSPNMIDSSPSTRVHRTSVEIESMMPNDQSFEDDNLTSNIMFTKDDLMPTITPPLPTAVHTNMKDEPTHIPPEIHDILPTSISFDTLIPMTEPSTEKVPEPTMPKTEKMPTSSTLSTSMPVFTPMLPGPSDTTDHNTSQEYPPSSSLSPHTPNPEASTTVPVSSSSVSIPTTFISSSIVPNTDSHPLVVPTATAEPTETPAHPVYPEGPDGDVTEEGTPEEDPEKGDEPEPGISKDDTTFPDITHTSPFPHTTPAPPSPTITHEDSLPTVTTTFTSPPPPTVTHESPEVPPVTTPEPTRVTSSDVIPVTSEAPSPVTTPEPEIVTSPPVTTSPPPPPPPSVTTPSTTTTTTTEKSTTTTSSTTTTATPVTTPEATFPSPTEGEPSLTTTMMLPNGTIVDAPLPHIRAQVAYNIMQFCSHMHNFRALFSQWLTQHLSGQAMVKPKDIEFFNMPSCPSSPPAPEEDLGNNIEDHIDDGETNVYFYITRSGVMDPDLTEQFPRFPMDLEIDEELTYLRPKVTQLELVQGHGDSITDLLEQEASLGTSVIVIIVICTIVVIVIILALLFFMVVKRKGATNNYYGRRCTPVSMDAYSMDSVSVYHSFRRKSKRRASGRSIKSYLNQAFDDPNGPSRPLNFAKLTHFISDIDGVHEEFSTIPVNMPKYDELPAGVEDKNRYANVIPVPETRVLLKANKESRHSEYINANYVRGARNESKYYIATQAPLDDTVADFWRMIWEQETKVIVMLTDFVEKGIDKCADYLPPSETLDCHRLYGDFQVTLKSRDMKEKFVVSNVQLKNLENNLIREVDHMWFTGWPAAGVPNEEAGFISFILEVRRRRKKLRAKGPITVHCSPGTGRSGTWLACDIVMKQFEEQRNIDVPKTVYAIRRDRAGAVQTKEQYAFIYRVINLYASKLTSGNLDSL